MAYVDIDSYKSDLLTDLISNPKIIEALNVQGITTENSDELIYKNIFPYIFIPDIQKDTSTYILIAVDEDRVLRSNTTYHNIAIYFRIMAHKNAMRTNYGATRIDYISRLIKDMMLGNTKYGFKEPQLIGNREKVLEPNYQYRDMTFTTNDFVESQRK